MDLSLRFSTCRNIPRTRLTRKYLLLILEIFKEKEEGKIRSLSCQKREAVNNCNRNGFKPWRRSREHQYSNSCAIENSSMKIIYRQKLKKSFLCQLCAPVRSWRSKSNSYRKLRSEILRCVLWWINFEQGLPTSLIFRICLAQERKRQGQDDMMGN